MLDAIETEFAVEPSDLERHVRRSWQQPMDGDQRPLARTTTMNVIAVAPVADEALLRSALRTLFHQSPCIAFLVFLTDREAPLETSFGVHTEKGPHSRRVLLECVTMRAGRSERRRIPSLVRPLLLDDLPTQFFWAGAVPADAGLLYALGSLADQVVYDSSLFADPDADRRRMESFRLGALDLTWTRLRAWRRALAEAFEHHSLRSGDGIEVVIEHGDTMGTRAASLVLAHWIESRLGTKVEIVARPKPDAPASEPCALHLRTRSSELHIEHCWPNAQLRVSMALPHANPVPYEVR